MIYYLLVYSEFNENKYQKIINTLFDSSQMQKEIFEIKNSFLILILVALEFKIKDVNKKLENSINQQIIEILVISN